MNQESSTQAVHRAQALCDEMAQFLAELVSIPSPSGEEERVAARIVRAMEEAGFDEVRIDGLGSVIGRIGDGPIAIAMDAHIDTVDAGNRELWGFDPFEGHVRDGKVWGRGAADQKGGMAALIYAGRIVKELGLDRGGAFTLYVTGTVMEEDCDGLCWQHLIQEEGLRPEVCVITEPTGCRVYRGQRGRMEIGVEVRGFSAHGSAPERGVNAIYRMTDVVREIERLNERLRGEGFLGRGNIAVTHIAGQGPSLCAIPDLCRIHLDRRLTEGETRETALAEVRAILDACAWASQKDAARVSVPRFERPSYTGKAYPCDAFFPAWTVPADHRAVVAAEQVSGALPGAGADSDRSGPPRWTFSTNGVAICGMHGIPCVGFGPAYEEQAHAPDEFCPVDHLVRAAAFYALYPGAYCAMA